MILGQNHIALLILSVCGWVGMGAAGVWGGSGLLVMLSLGGAWIWGNSRQHPWIGLLCFLGLMLISIVGMLKHTQEMVFVSGMMGALVVWDLERFALRLQTGVLIKNQPLLVRQHLFRLGAVLGLGFLLVAMAFEIELHLEFWYTIPLIGLIFAGVNSILRLSHPPASSFPPDQRAIRKDNRKP